MRDSRLTRGRHWRSVFAPNWQRIGLPSRGGSRCGWSSQSTRRSANRCRCGSGVSGAGSMRRRRRSRCRCGRQCSVRLTCRELRRRGNGRERHRTGRTHFSSARRKGKACNKRSSDRIQTRCRTGSTVWCCRRMCLHRSRRTG